MAKILVVEDSFTMRGLITAVLHGLGDYDIIEAENGMTALAMLQRDPFALVITDLMMPSINGFELLAFIKQQPHLTGTPIIVLSNDHEPQKKEKARLLGASEYLHKPFQPKLLKDIAQIYLQQK